MAYPNNIHRISIVQVSQRFAKKFGGWGVKWTSGVFQSEVLLVPKQLLIPLALPHLQ